MNRRNFLTTTALGVSALAAGPALLANSKKQFKKAIQLVSVIPGLKRDVQATIQALSHMGYAGVEIAHRFGGTFGLSPHDFKKILTHNGMACTGATVSVNDLEGENLKKTASFFAEIGGKYINQAEQIVAKQDITSSEAWIKAAEKYNRLSEQLAQYNLVLGLHNHTEEFLKTENGQSGWEIFFSNTRKDIVHELDVCHCMEGGGDPVALINKFGWRTKVIHIKEYPRNQTETFKDAIDDPIAKGKFAVPFGKGKAPWKEIFEACKTNGGTEWYIAEYYMGGSPDNQGKDLIVAKQMVDFLKQFE